MQRREWKVSAGSFVVSVSDALTCYPPVGPTADVVFTPLTENGKLSVAVRSSEPVIVGEAQGLLDSGGADTFRRNLDDFADLLAEFYGPQLPPGLSRALRETPQ